MDDIYWVMFTDGYVECLCTDKLSCTKGCKKECKEYVLSFTEIHRKANEKFSVDDKIINKLKRARTELERNLRKVKI